jgi:putative NIF3 family GTP cyclohydrolase 1 type 2
MFNRESEVRIEMNAPAGRVEAVVAALAAAHPYEEPAYDVVERRGDAGFVGRVGTIGPATTLRSLAARVTGRCGGVVRIAGDPDRPIATVAVVPGSGGDLVDAAAGIADALVTGDIGHHRARRALDRGLSVVDPGHAPTERPGVRALYAAVAAAGTEVADLTGRDDSPWHEGGPWTS